MSCKEYTAQICDILESGDLTDCNFLVGPESDLQLIPSFKFILATTSPVFRAMFYGSLAEKTDPVTMPDVQPADFKIFLKYIYTDKIELSSLEEASGVYYCAKKFLLPHLQQLCSEFLLSNLDASNVCQVYEEHAQLFEDSMVTDRANKIMTDNTNLVLNDPSFEEIKFSTLLHIFSLDELCIDSEMDLFEAAVRYYKAQGESMTQNEAADKTELLPIQSVIEKIRFLTVTPKQFVECQTKELLMSESEILSILSNLVSCNTKIPYPSRLCPSRESRVQKFIRFNFTVQDIRNLSDCLYSTNHFARDFSWRILVRPEPFPYTGESKEKFLGVYLECDYTKSLNWKGNVDIEMTLLSQTSSSLNLSRSCTRKFITASKLWGWNKFMAWKLMLDPSKGYVKDEAIVIQASLKNLEYSLE